MSKTYKSNRVGSQLDKPPSWNKPFSKKEKQVYLIDLAQKAGIERKNADNTLNFLSIVRHNLIALKSYAQGFNISSVNVNETGISLYIEFNEVLLGEHSPFYGRTRYYNITIRTARFSGLTVIEVFITITKPGGIFNTPSYYRLKDDGSGLTKDEYIPTQSFYQYFIQSETKGYKAVEDHYWNIPTTNFDEAAEDFTDLIVTCAIGQATRKGIGMATRCDSCEHQLFCLNKSL